MEGLDTMEDREPVWEHYSDYWPYSSTTHLVSGDPSSLFAKRSKKYMSRTGKRGGGSLGGGPSEMMRMGKRDGQKRYMIRMGKRGGHDRIMKRDNDYERMMKRSWMRMRPLTWTL